MHEIVSVVHGVVLRLRARARPRRDWWQECVIFDTLRGHGKRDRGRDVTFVSV